MCKTVYGSSSANPIAVQCSMDIAPAPPSSAPSTGSHSCSKMDEINETYSEKSSDAQHIGLNQYFLVCVWVGVYVCVVCERYVLTAPIARTSMTDWNFYVVAI